MERTYAYFFVALIFLFPVYAHAQCKDQLCSNIQDILDGAISDFRGYAAHTVQLPNVSTESTKVPCSANTWANNVPMLICFAQVPLSNATEWYARTMDALKLLSPSWHFDIKAPGDSRYVYAGPPDCEQPTPTEGPYIGQCPLHLEVSKQPDGSAKIYLIVNSLSSPNLLHHTLLSPTPAKPRQSTQGGVSLGTSGCDEFCGALKKAFEARTTNFAEPRPDKLPGAKDCLVKKVSASTDAGVKFVCYWQEASTSAGETRFRDLVARLQILLPSNWSSRQENEVDEQTGVPLIAWYADEPGAKHGIRVYLSTDAVALHITAWK
jgi:hypothetical protein